MKRLVYLGNKEFPVIVIRNDLWVKGNLKLYQVIALCHDLILIYENRGKSEYQLPFILFNSSSEPDLRFLLALISLLPKR